MIASDQIEISSRRREKRFNDRDAEDTEGAGDGREVI
jgi:hypothetical protein